MDGWWWWLLLENAMAMGMKNVCVYICGRPPPLFVLYIQVSYRNGMVGVGGGYAPT